MWSVLQTAHDQSPSAQRNGSSLAASSSTLSPVLHVNIARSEHRPKNSNIQQTSCINTTKRSIVLKVGSVMQVVFLRDFENYKRSNNSEYNKTGLFESSRVKHGTKHSHLQWKSQRFWKRLNDARFAQKDALAPQLCNESPHPSSPSSNGRLITSGHIWTAASRTMQCNETSSQLDQDFLEH